MLVMDVGAIVCHSVLDVILDVAVLDVGIAIVCIVELDVILVVAMLDVGVAIVCVGELDVILVGDGGWGSPT